MDAPDASAPAGSNRSEVAPPDGPLHRVKEWILIDGDRRLLSTGIAVVLFASLLGLHATGHISFDDGNTLSRLAGGMIAGTFSLVTLVVSINQLILSRDFQAAGEVREQLDDAMAFRAEIEDATGASTTPAAPSQLLQLVVGTIHDRAVAIGEEIGGETDQAERLVSWYVNDVTRTTVRVEETLAETKFGTANAVSAAIKYRDEWHLYAALTLRNRHAASLSDRARQELDALIECLQLFAIAREHLKTTYLQRELTRFSQLTVLCGIPAVAAAIVLGLIYAVADGSTVSPEVRPVVVSALIAVVFFPLALLGAYILQTATIARRTSSIGPFLPEKEPESGPFDQETDNNA